MRKEMYKIRNTNKNKDLVKLIKSGLIDSKMKIKTCLKTKKELKGQMS